jgi:hypothetical protein
MDVPQSFKFCVENSGGFEIRQHYNMVDFSGLSGFFIDRADLAGEDKMYIVLLPQGFRSTGSGQPFRKRGPFIKFQAGFFFQPVKATVRILKVIPQFLYPLWMGAIAGSKKANALDSSPSLKACGA